MSRPEKVVLSFVALVISITLYYVMIHIHAVKELGFKDTKEVDRWIMGSTAFCYCSVVLFFYNIVQLRKELKIKEDDYK